MKKRKIILIVLGAALLLFYFFPTSHKSFNQLYHSSDLRPVSSLNDFRAIPTNSIEYQNKEWKYLSLGKGEETVLFLHGMAGSYDIWWQQMLVLQDSFKVISLTYPPATSLNEMGEAIMKILDQENIEMTNLVGSSLGGYFAQYLKTTYPTRIRKVVLGNTFPPNDLYKEKNNGTAMLARILPEWLVMTVFRGSLMKNVVPASENSPIVEAFMLEQSYGGMSKGQFLARYQCVIDKFTPSPEMINSFDVFIIESDNDPLIFPELREQLRQLYPNADVLSYHNLGHFPYLCQPEDYTQTIVNFMNQYD